MLTVDEPTLTMNFCVNNSPLAGREGKFVTSRQICATGSNASCRATWRCSVKETDEDGIFEVSGRGELHLTILLENMRREGYELAVSKPRVVFHEVDGEQHEPIELVTADVEDSHQGGVMQALGERKAELVNMEPDGSGRVRLEYRIPARGLIGFSERVHESDARHRPDQQHLRRLRGLQGRDRRAQERRADQPGRRRDRHLRAGQARRPRPHVRASAGDPVYEGMIVGIHSRDNDLVVNAVRAKQLTNFRVSGKEEAIKITPPIDLTLEYAVEFIEDDELVEITPKSIRLRKRYLKEHDRKRASRGSCLTAAHVSSGVHTLPLPPPSGGSVWLTPGSLSDPL